MIERLRLLATACCDPWISKPSPDLGYVIRGWEKDLTDA